MRAIVFISFVSVFIFFSCKSTKSPEGKESVSGTVSVVGEKEPLQQKYIIPYQVQSLKDSIRNLSVKKNDVSAFYKKNQYRPVWLKESFDLKGFDLLLSYLQNASEHGLNPEWFKKSEIQTLVDSLHKGAFNDSIPRSYQLLARLECLSVQALIDYSTSIQYGLVFPKEQLPNSYYISTQRPDTAYYNQLFKAISSSPDSLLKALQPTTETYTKLQQALRFYDVKKDSTFKSIPSKKGKNYGLNEKNVIFPLIAKRLMLTGELPYTANADSAYVTLTPELLEAVNRFRRANSYPEDKEIGNITIDALNRPLSYYYQKILANLERYRWKRQSQVADKYIEVNVAAFNLKAIEKGQEPLLMNVCVGSVKNKTPLLESNITYVNLNPAWHVPSSIIKKEIYFSLKSDTTYLQRKRMKLLKDGQEVDPATVNWNDVDAEKFPYQIRQNPGSGNSLGRIKFMFKNPFSVYLHDTPMKKGLTAKNRAVSHGCVRVQNPVGLAYFCLEDVDSVYFDRIRYSIDQPPLTGEGKNLLKRGKLQKVRDVVNLNETVPVFIDYFTVYMLPKQDQLFFADDVYGFDGKIVEGVNKQGEKLGKRIAL